MTAQVGDSLAAPQRVLVTGADGRVGRAVVAELCAAGHDVTAFVDGRPGQRRQASPDLAGAQVIPGDARDPKAVAQAIQGSDALVHLAAIRHPSLGTPFEVFSNNVISTFAALSAAGESQLSRVVTASSINATGIPLNRRRAMPAYFPLDADLPVEHDDAYSLAKYCDEASLAMGCRRWEMTGIALRLPLITTSDTIDGFVDIATRDPGAFVREGWAYLDVQDCAHAFRLAVEARFEGTHVLMISSDTTLLDAPTEALLARYAPGVPVRRSIPGRSAPIDLDPVRRLIGFSAGGR